jgi:uncharacterized membrane protein
MTFEERTTWVSAIVAIGGVVGYFSALLARAGASDVSEVPFVDLMLIYGIGIPIIVTIVVVIVVTAIWHRDSQTKDQRDKAIDRHGEYVGGILLAVLMIVPFGLALGDVATFWIAHAMYLAFFTSALTGAIVKIVAYRRGI